MPLPRPEQAWLHFTWQSLEHPCGQYHQAWQPVWLQQSQKENSKATHLAVTYGPHLSANVFLTWGDGSDPRTPRRGPSQGKLGS